MTAELVTAPDTATLDVAVDLRCKGWTAALPAVDDVCRRAAAAALAAADIPPEDIEISLVLADDAFIRALNRQWRDKDAPTNVLAFPCSDSREADGIWLLGDVVVAFETTRREADAAGKPLGHHLAHLVVHGVLHLLGYDHVSDEEANEMEALEVVALNRLGIEDPYSPIEPDSRPLPK